MNGPIDVPLSRVMGGLTVQVTITGQRAFRLRTWLGLKLLTLAGVVLGTHRVSVAIAP